MALATQDFLGSDSANKNTATALFLYIIKPEDAQRSEDVKSAV